MPACGYYLVETINWTIPAGAPITQETDGGTNMYKLVVSSTDPDKHATYELTIDNSALYATLQTTYTSSLTFEFVVTDPCLTT